MSNPETNHHFFERSRVLESGGTTRALLTAMLGGIGVIAADFAPQGRPELRRTVASGEIQPPKGLDVMGSRELAAMVAEPRRRALAAPALRAAMERPFALNANS